MGLSTSRDRRSRERWLGGWLVALLLCAWPAALWHEATTVHVVCPEHGEVLDLASPVEEADGHSERGRHDGPAWVEGGADGSAHEACSFAVLGQPTTKPTHPTKAGVHLTECGERPAVRPPVPGLPIAILRQAPKHSPPA